ncbi:hypothetical protein HydSN_0250 [Hydrogenobaculum sp. SN]|jgi:hypothetical protein|nr:hypothetical protein Hyd3684_0241 [Hydrogenobaculum sp. 3684]AEG45935.1 hypothetical protein HydSHO_0241 [Hydrogenobaculum sp. SHO]AGG14578.1 hypothetical protein HydHO_0242 [Hydrogenobaculum sp. HO]AGH92878.1 hypothetical protein HydSN_0250 [Hydrogenobaculum sp. SN]
MERFSFWAFVIAPIFIPIVFGFIYVFTKME